MSEPEAAVVRAAETTSDKRQIAIATQGARVVELFTACTLTPDDLELAVRADRALGDLETLLAASPE